ncbi:MAG: hypothetical protein IT304_06675 [Dehalococcoidia bacterium]|nr:hypothetical protein [Dehalococcoidia bacterium]
MEWVTRLTSSDARRAPDLSRATPVLRPRRGRLRERLRDWRFWVVQALVLTVTTMHCLVEITRPFDLGAVYFLPAALYLFPVLYASLNFGREGAIPTAVWSALLATPNVFLWHVGVEAMGEVFQLTTMLLLGTVVALRVEKEREARRSAEAAERERRSSELKYRSLFDGAGEAILLSDADGHVLEANAAALALDRSTRPPTEVITLEEMLGQGGTTIRRSIAGDLGDEDIVVRRVDGQEMWLEPRLTPLPSADGEALTQVLLRDVTDRHGFQHYAQEVMKAQESERQRIAHELHDVSVQSAILICRQLDFAVDTTESGDRAQTVAALAEARHAAEEMADELRRFSRDLRPLILEDLGLIPALKRLLAELRERTRIRVRFHVVGGARRLDPAVELALFRIGQEAVRNVERHSGASSMSVTVVFRAEAVLLSVIDNGKGFAVPPLTLLVRQGRLGLLGMHERARLVHGKCQILSPVGGGTRVLVDVPAPTIGREDDR